MLLPGGHHHRLLLTNQSEGVGHTPLILALPDLGEHTEVGTSQKAVHL